MPSLAPDATEVAYPGWKDIGYRDSAAGYIGGIFLFENHVKLIFERGAILPDSETVLQGNTRQTRYILIAPEDDIPRGAIAALISTAIDTGRGLRSAQA